MGIFATPRYQEIVVHDLRTPLNVITLALRMIDYESAALKAGIAEDLNLIQSGAHELDRMLTYLLDFSRLPDNPSGLATGRFNPARMVDEIVENQILRSGQNTISFEALNPPSEVFLDEFIANMAIQKALLNTIAAAQGKPVKVRATGGPDRLILEFLTDVPPRDSVQSHVLSCDTFERVIGSAAERRGLELTIAARVSQLFGGTAKLEVRAGTGTTVTLDWPVRIEKS